MRASNRQEYADKLSRKFGDYRPVIRACMGCAYSRDDHRNFNVGACAFCVGFNRYQPAKGGAK